MKKVLLVLVLSFSVTQLWSQKMGSSDVRNRPKEDKIYHVPLIGDQTPSFTAKLTNGIINFPIVGDENLSISRKYGMIHPSTSSTKTVRGVFIIDPDNKVEAVLFYPMNIGRSTDELLRMITALKTTYADNVCTPVNWKAGDDILIPYNPTPSKDLAKAGILPPEGYYNLAWFVLYKKGNQ
jgi:peroxiredoxin 2/4